VVAVVSSQVFPLVVEKSHLDFVVRGGARTLGQAPFGLRVKESCGVRKEDEADRLRTRAGSGLLEYQPWPEATRCPRANILHQEVCDRNLVITPISFQVFPLVPAAGPQVPAC
jgi:hypothetical protein